MKQAAFEFDTDIVLAPEPIAEVKTSGKYWLFNSLLKGCYIMRRKSHDGKFDFCLYQPKKIPVKFIKYRDLKKLQFLLRQHNDTFILNLKSVRKLHGNTIHKKLYKQFKQKQKIESQIV